MNAVQHIAVLPARIRARWDRLALEQLCEAAPRLDKAREDAEKYQDWAERDADHHQHLWLGALDQLAERCETPRLQAGITQDGELVVVGAPS